MTHLYRIEWSAYDLDDGTPAEADRIVGGLEAAREVARVQSAEHGLATIAAIDEGMERRHVESWERGRLVPREVT